MENMSGTNKEITYNNHNSEQQQHGSDPDRFDGSGASVTPISVGSRLLKSPSAAVRYRECLKNHAANIGGNVTDGCCEFMPSGNDGTLEALKCAACNCHRNFHRKELAATPIVTAGHFLQLPTTLSAASPSFNHHHHHHHQLMNWASSVNVPAPGSTYPPLNASPLKIAVGGSGGATDSSSEELHFTMGSPSGVAKKRFRSKFTQDQKEKMLEFAEKVGWRIPREDDPEVQRFCEVVGVKRKVLKVWMHNNKAAVSGKKHVQDSNETTE